MVIPNTQSYSAAIPNPSYQPAMRNILSITQGFPCLITTTFNGTTPGDHLYITGVILRLYIPDGFGMTQANYLTSAVTVTSPTTFTMDIDTTNFDAFVIPDRNPGHYGTPAQCVPVGEVNDSLLSAEQNVLKRT